MNDPLLHLRLFDDGGALGAFHHMHGTAADYGATHSAGGQLRQGHSH
ncbi:hypothetical protein RN629_17195 [Sphingomonadaceae bacterium jetA1]|jgi:hypothetical protein